MSAELTEIDEEDQGAFNDAIMALEALGYRPDSIRKTVKKIYENLGKGERSSENIIKLALSALNT